MKVFHLKFETTEEKIGDELAAAAASTLRSIPGVLGAHASRSFDSGPAVVVVQAADDFDTKLLPEGAELVHDDKPANSEERATDDTPGEDAGRGRKAAK